ncbi:hypothetical protein JCM5353_002127 [Sporobolomyces roseus]
MLSSLPTELLRQIIESTVPSTYHSETYRSRQTTLLTLSLVSSCFRQIAQPLLRQVICLPLRKSDPDGVARIFNAACLQRWDKDARQFAMHIEDDTDPYRSGFTVDQVVLFFPRLVELTVSQYTRYLKQTELYVISRLSGMLPGLSSSVLDSSILISPELRSLQTSYYDLDPVHLPKLESLTLIVSRHGLKSLLQPSMLPSLRALALGYIHQDELLDLLCNPSSRLLLHQIEALFVRVDVFIDSDAILRKMQPFLSKTLVHLEHDQMSAHCRTLSTLPHLRLHFEDPYAPLAKAIEEDDHSSLKSLYLAVPRQASHFGGSQREPDRSDLLAICSSRKIEVIEEEQPSDRRLDPHISFEFWRRQRELKRLAGVQ